MSKLIGIDVYAALHYPRGMGMYIINLINELMKNDKENNYILYSDVDDKNKLLKKNNNFIFKKLPANNHFHYEQILLPKQCKLDKIEILFSPANTSPIFLGEKIKRILALHDVIFLKKEVPLSKNKRQVLGRIYYSITSLNAKKASVILTPTEYSKNDIIKTLHISPNKIIVDSRGHEHFNTEKATEFELLKQKYNIPQKYFFHVGGDAPSKNTDTLLELFSKEKDMNIVIAGIKNLEISHLYNRYKSFTNIIFVPYVSQEDLVGLYKNAEAFIFPSIFEGFGLPLLEAMKCNCPVLCSNATCLHEVAGNAALYFNPNDINSILTAIKKIKFDPEIRKDLFIKGQKQLEKYSWRHCTEKYLEGLRNV